MNRCATLRCMQKSAWSNSRAKGFGKVKANRYTRPVTRLMLMVSEIAEAMEELRSGRRADEIYFGKDGKPEGVPIELADVVIRIGDFAQEHGFDLQEAVQMKMAFNCTRPKMHGGKKF